MLVHHARVLDLVNIVLVHGQYNTLQNEFFALNTSCANFFGCMRAKYFSIGNCIGFNTKDKYGDSPLLLLQEIGFGRSSHLSTATARLFTSFFLSKCWKHNWLIFKSLESGSILTVSR